MYAAWSTWDDRKYWARPGVSIRSVLSPPLHTGPDGSQDHAGDDGEWFHGGDPSAVCNQKRLAIFSASGRSLSIDTMSFCVFAVTSMHIDDEWNGLACAETVRNSAPVRPNTRGRASWRLTRTDPSSESHGSSLTSFQAYGHRRWGHGS